MDYEEALIAKIVLEKSIREVSEHNLQSELFLQCKKEWEYVVDFYRKHGESPPLDHFEKLFPDFDLTPSDAPMSFLIEELRNRLMYNLATAAMKEATEHLKQKDSGKAVDVFRSMVLKAELQTRPSKDVDLVENPLDRLKEYDERVEKGGLLGLPSPWPILDDVTLGFMAEELWMIVARGGVGKSWCEVVGSRFHWTMGIRSLLVTKEMAVRQIIQRFDAAHARIAHKRLRSGELTTDEYERYRETLEQMEESRVPFLVSGDDEGTGGVSGILAKIDRYRPGVVWIDGLYLIEDERRGKGEAGWEKLKNVTGDLKAVARQRGIPIIVSHQFSKEGREDQGSADTLAYGDIQKWFDGILGMYQSEDLRLNREMMFKLLKHREGERCEFVANWDLENMLFEEKGAALDDVGVDAGEDDTIPF